MQSGLSRSDLSPKGFVLGSLDSFKRSLEDIVGHMWPRDHRLPTLDLSNLTGFSQQHYEVGAIIIPIFADKETETGEGTCQRRSYRLCHELRTFGLQAQYPVPPSCLKSEKRFQRV